MTPHAVSTTQLVCAPPIFSCATYAPPSSFTALAIFATEPSSGRSTSGLYSQLLAVEKGASGRHDQDDAQAELEQGAGHDSHEKPAAMTAPSTDPRPMGATVSEIAARALAPVAWNRSCN